MLPGLDDLTLDSQRVFRAVLEAMAHPGRVVDVAGLAAAPPPIHPAAAAVALTLADFETPVWLDAAAAAPEVVEYLRFHCGCPIVEAPGAARFALVAAPAELPPLTAFDAGTDEDPHRSATLIVQTAALCAGRGRSITGPGVRDRARLDVTGLPAWFWPQWRESHGRFPRGIDVILTAGRVLAALPRTAWLED